MRSAALLAICFVSAVTTATPYAQPASRAVADMRNQEGKPVGTVTLTQAAYGVVLLIRLQNLPAGPHAFHVHAIGVCEPPFKSAGGHYNPHGLGHGAMDRDGMHAGDLPNIHVSNTGKFTGEAFAPRVNLDAALFDVDGAAIVIHQGPDDYQSDPAGAAGPRIACGVIVAEDK